MSHPALPLLEALRTADGATFDALLAKLAALPLGSLSQAEIGQLLGALDATTQVLRASQNEASTTLRGMRQGVQALQAYGAKGGLR